MDMRRVETKLYMRPDGSGEITIKVWETIGEITLKKAKQFIQNYGMKAYINI